MHLKVKPDGPNLPKTVIRSTTAQQRHRMIFNVIKHLTLDR